MLLAGFDFGEMDVKATIGDGSATVVWMKSGKTRYDIPPKSMFTERK